MNSLRNLPSIIQKLNSSRGEFLFGEKLLIRKTPV